MTALGFWGRLSVFPAWCTNECWAKFPDIYHLRHICMIWYVNIKRPYNTYNAIYRLLRVVILSWHLSSHSPKFPKQPCRISNNTILWYTYDKPTALLFMKLKTWIQSWQCVNCIDLFYKDLSHFLETFKFIYPEIQLFAIDIVLRKNLEFQVHVAIWH